MAADEPPPPMLSLSHQPGSNFRNVGTKEAIIDALTLLLHERVFTSNEDAKKNKVNELITIAEKCESVEDFRKKANIPHNYVIDSGGLKDYINNIVGGGRRKHTRKHRTRRNKKQRKYRTRKH